MAITTRMSTGITVQAISIIVLWLGRDGGGVTDSRDLKTTQPSSAMTKAVMMMMIHSTSVLKSWMASFTGPAAGCRPMPQGVGMPTELCVSPVIPPEGEAV